MLFSLYTLMLTVQAEYTWYFSVYMIHFQTVSASSFRWLFTSVSFYLASTCSFVLYPTITWLFTLWLSLHVCFSLSHILLYLVFSRMVPPCKVFKMNWIELHCNLEYLFYMDNSCLWVWHNWLYLIKSIQTVALGSWINAFECEWINSA